MNTIKDILNQGAKVIDVRTPAEFMAGNVVNSVNIPLNEIPERVEEFKNMPKPLVLCCAVGGRSGQAIQFLTQHGVDGLHNGGGWMDVNYVLNNE